MTISVKHYTLSVNNGAKLGTFTSTKALGDAFVAHFGKGHRGLANKLVDAIEHGRDLSRLETVLGVHVESFYDSLAA